MKTATNLQEHDHITSDQEAKVFKMDPPLEGHNYVLLSKVNRYVFELDEKIIETYIFPCNEKGEVLSWLELQGSKKGVHSIDSILEDLGYTPIYS